MHYRLQPSEILAAWETGAARCPLDRALAVLWAADAADGLDPADLPLVERDRRLLAIRRATFGPSLPARATCWECGAELEMAFDADDLASALPDLAVESVVRPLTSRDLAVLLQQPADTHRALLCQRLGECAATGDTLTVERAVEQAIDDAELRIRLVCCDCGAEWSEMLDVPAHVWADVETTAWRLLGEVAELAQAYGWTESEILALSPARRQAYLAHVRRP